MGRSHERERESKKRWQAKSTAKASFRLKSVIKAFNSEPQTGKPNAGFLFSGANGPGQWAGLIKLIGFLLNPHQPDIISNLSRKILTAFVTMLSSLYASCKYSYKYCKKFQPLFLDLGSLTVNDKGVRSNAIIPA